MPEAYNLGLDARNDFKPITSNPYEKGTLDWHDWMDGWTDTDQELNEAIERNFD